MSSLQRALALGWMQELGLPVSSLLMSLAEEVAHASARPAPAPRRASLVLTQDGLDLATVVVERLARTLRPGATGGDEGLARATLADLGRAAEAAARRLQDQPQILSRAGLIWSGRQPASLANLADWLERASADQPTIDRAQALVWLQEAAGRRPASAATPAAALPELPAPWKRGHTATGMPRWQWPAGEPLPQRLALAGGGSAAWAWVSFDSASPVAPSLPVRLERSLWRVVTLPRATPASRPPPCEAPDSSCGALDPGRMTVRLERVEPGSPVDTRSLYLDRIEVLSERDMKRVLTEVALPPGAQVESTTWGLDLEETRQPLEAARHQTHARGYALPIDALDAGRPQVFRHLVRFAQHGRFVLPPARLHRMYDPEAVALESPAAWPGVDVR
jgi:uncharacterized protein YfaS (alpha-2-macroglobulin family)